MSNSPLSEASSESLSELFAKDPLELTTEDISRVVSELRAQRERWMVAEKKGRAPKAETKVITDLSELGL
jgi:hypothetical protein